MAVDTFYVRTGRDGLARYTIEIPVMDMAEGFQIELTDGAGNELAVTKSGPGLYVAERQDTVGQRKAVIRIASSLGEETDRREIQINIAEGIDPDFRSKVLALLERCKGVVDATLVSAIREICTVGKGDEIEVVCDEYERPDADPNLRSRCLAFLDHAAQTLHARNQNRKLSSVVLHAVRTGDPTTRDKAVCIAMAAKLKPVDRFELLVSIFPDAPDSRHMNLLTNLKDITPSSERPRVAQLAMEAAEFGGGNGFLIRAVLVILEAFNYRQALPWVRELVQTNTDVSCVGVAVNLLNAWDDKASSPFLLNLLDITNDSTIAANIVAMFRKWDCRDVRPKIEAMIPLSGSAKASTLASALANWK